MTEGKKPTRRQLEALLAVYNGRSARSAPTGYSHHGGSNCGGAISRMVEHLGETGLLQRHVSRGGYTYTDSVLTAAGLRALNDHGGYDLPGFEERLAERVALEARLAAEAEAERAQARADAETARVARREARASLFRDLMQSYQVDVSGLTDDQCRDVWTTIVDKEMAL